MPLYNTNIYSYVHFVTDEDIYDNFLHNLKVTTNWYHYWQHLFDWIKKKTCRKQITMKDFIYSLHFKVSKKLTSDIRISATRIQIGDSYPFGELRVETIKSLQIVVYKIRVISRDFLSPRTVPKSLSVANKYFKEARWLYEVIKNQVINLIFNHLT